MNTSMSISILVQLFSGIIQIAVIGFAWFSIFKMKITGNGNMIWSEFLSGQAYRSNILDLRSEDLDERAKILDKRERELRELYDMKG